MKALFSLVALALVFSFSACTKKEAAPVGDEEYVEGTTSSPDEDMDPADEMQEKEGGDQEY
jgi:hypothetical protein